MLMGHVLKFWDYPTEDPDVFPIMTLDLMNCFESEVNIVDRKLCAKPRTIMLEVLTDDPYNDSDSDSTLKKQR